MPVPLVRKTTNFIPRAAESIASSAERDRITETDVLNRAVQLYELVSFRRARGESLAFINDSTGTVTRVEVL